MSVFIDASAIVAILAKEPDAADLSERLESATAPVLVSSLVVFEATLGLARNKAGPGVRLTSEGLADAKAAVRRFLAVIDAREVALTIDLGFAAIEAISRFGKHVGHPAGLNMGDAFAYACTTSVDAGLLYKGADFPRTDVSVV